VPSSILITGGAGFIGQNLVHWLRKSNPSARLCVLDILSYAANPASLKPLIDSQVITFVPGDIRDKPLVSDLFSQYRFDAVMHLAAESHVDRSIAEPDGFIETNILGTYTLLKVALANWSREGRLEDRRFLHVSTDEVYGDLEPSDDPFTEHSPYRPSSPYSASKAASDHLVRAFCRTYGLAGIITNCSNNYGSYQHPEKLIPLMIIHALEGKPLPIYGDGSNVRDWLSVEDHCLALEQILLKGRLGTTYNIGGGSERTNSQVVSAICSAIDEIFQDNPSFSKRYPQCPAASGKPCSTLITFVQDRPGHDRRYAINSDKLRNELGISARQPFEARLKETVLWYAENESWWRNALSGDFQAWIETNYRHRMTKISG
jgi:dTDP-glucose 4,6-dehydratase